MLAIQAQQHVKSVTHDNQEHKFNLTFEINQPV